MVVRWNEHALEDREELVRYIAKDSVFAAFTVGQRINDQVERLGAFSEMGRSGRVVETRELVIKATSYIAVYRIADDVVEILRVLHAAQEWPSVI